MSRSREDEDRSPLHRREFLRVAGLGVAGLAAGAAGCTTPASEAGGPARPVPASEPHMNFAVFTDTHVGQKTRSPQWDFAEHLDLLAPPSSPPRRPDHRRRLVGV